MARAGHTFSKAAFLREKALFAGEISGHFFFRELNYDDGMYAGLTICDFVAQHGALSALVDAIPNYLLTPDIRVKYSGSDKEAVLEEIAAALVNFCLYRHIPLPKKAQKMITAVEGQIVLALEIGHSHELRAAIRAVAAHQQR